MYQQGKIGLNHPSSSCTTYKKKKTWRKRKDITSIFFHSSVRWMWSPKLYFTSTLASIQLLVNYFPSSPYLVTFLLQKLFISKLNFDGQNMKFISLEKNSWKVGHLFHYLICVFLTLIFRREAFIKHFKPYQNSNANIFWKTSNMVRITMLVTASISLFEMEIYKLNEVQDWVQFWPRVSLAWSANMLCFLTYYIRRPPTYHSQYVL